MPQAVRKIQLVSNLSDPYNYEYTEEESQKIIKAIKSEFDDLQASFRKGINKEKGKFKL